MKEYQYESFYGERALFNSRGLKIINSTFSDGESPLKESEDIWLLDSIFKWKYPMWYCENIFCQNVTLLETARSGIWYTRNIEIIDSVIEAPKTFRRAEGIKLKKVSMPNAMETLWNCKNVEMTNVTAKGDYFAMNTVDIKVDNLVLHGNYGFDGGKNIEVYNSKLISKDCFWNCENVYVKDSLIMGEYLGWNSKNVTFENCTIESLQGLCYMDNVKLINCTLMNTNLAFEFSTVDAEVVSNIISVTNPISGVIKARKIDDIILDPSLVKPKKTKIIVGGR